MAEYDKLDSWAKLLYLQTKFRARKRGNEFTLTKERFAQMLADCRGACSMTGIPFDLEPPRQRHQKRPFAASIDRIDNALGYTDTNCRLVCVAVNVAMNTWGEPVLWTIAEGLFTKNKTKWRRASHTRQKCPPGVKVSHRKNSGELRYGARLRIKGQKDRWLGTFATPEEAAAAVRAAQFGPEQIPGAEYKTVSA